MDTSALNLKVRRAYLTDGLWGCSRVRSVCQVVWRYWQPGFCGVGIDLMKVIAVGGRGTSTMVVPSEKTPSGLTSLHVLARERTLSCLN